MMRKIKRYKPIGFGDRQIQAQWKAIVTRWLRLLRHAYTTQRMKELAAQDEAKRPSLLSEVMGFFTSEV